MKYIGAYSFRKIRACASQFTM